MDSTTAAALNAASSLGRERPSRKDSTRTKPDHGRALHYTNLVIELLVAFGAAVTVLAELAVLFELAQISIPTIVTAWAAVAVAALALHIPLRAWVERDARLSLEAQLRQRRDSIPRGRQRSEYETAASKRVRNARWHWLAGITLSPARWLSLLVMAAALRDGELSVAVMVGRLAVITLVIECVVRHLTDKQDSTMGRWNT